MFLGVEATTIRAALLTAAQLSSYDHSKHLLKDQGILQEGFALHITSSIVSGLCATTAAAPADVIKSRIMAARKAAGGGAVMYTSVWDCVVKTMRNEGPMAFFKGWLPSYMRLGPHFLLVNCTIFNGIIIGLFFLFAVAALVRADPQGIWSRQRLKIIKK